MEEFVLPAEVQSELPSGPTSPADVLPPCTERQKAFAARMALGDSMSGATRYAGVHRTTGYEWRELPQVQAEIARYGRLAMDHARRMLVGEVQGAVRTLRQLSRHGQKESTRLAAAKLILDYNQIGEVPVGNTQTRIYSYIPRDLTDDQGLDTLDAIEAGYREEALPLTPTSDGLPPDFPRAEGEQAGHYAQPERSIPEVLTDPRYYRKSLMPE